MIKKIYQFIVEQKFFFAACIFLTFLLYVPGSIWRPNLEMIKNCSWNFKKMPIRFLKEKYPIVFFIPLCVGILGWANAIGKLFFGKFKVSYQYILGFFVSIVLIATVVFSLAVNEIFYPEIIILFFIPFFKEGWRLFKIIFCQLRQYKNKINGLIGLSSLMMVFWLFEFFSPPIIWDAVLDHFRFAEEVVRLHFLPLHWVNDTGDMPKIMESVLAAFWSLGQEALSKFSLILDWFLILGAFFLFFKQHLKRTQLAFFIFLSIPFFLAIFSWGYNESFLASFEFLSFICFVNFLETDIAEWANAGFLFLGTAFGIKYTALFAGLSVIGLLGFEQLVRKKKIHWKWQWIIWFLFPCLGWYLRNFLATRDPVYPLGTFIFGNVGNYTFHSELNLWKDTGSNISFNIKKFLEHIGTNFFTPFDALNAPWSPLILMSLPWWGSVFRKIRMQRYLILSLIFLVFWGNFCSTLRHASGLTILLLGFSVLGWQVAFKKEKIKSKILFGLAWLFSAFLLLGAQITSTVPYASALGLQNPLLQLKKNYYFNGDTFAAYHWIMSHSGPHAKVAVFSTIQAYPLHRIAYTDFFWRQPLFLRWASHCSTAHQFSNKLREKGIRFLLYERQESIWMYQRNKHFKLTHLPRAQYIRFFRYYVRPVKIYENTTVYRICYHKATHPISLIDLPGLEEPYLSSIQINIHKGYWNLAENEVNQFNHTFHDVAYFWYEKAWIEFYFHHYKRSIKDGRRSVFLGLNSLKLYAIMSMDEEQLGHLKKSIRWKQKFFNRQQWLRQVIAQGMKSEN
jgi:hypothetical protein